MVNKETPEDFVAAAVVPDSVTIPAPCCDIRRRKCNPITEARELRGCEAGLRFAQVAKKAWLRRSERKQRGEVPAASQSAGGTRKKLIRAFQEKKCRLPHFPAAAACRSSITWPLRVERAEG
jgi:hypothetical protein